MDIWIPVVVVIVSAFLGRPIDHLIASYQKKRLRNLLNAIETDSLMSLYSKDYRDRFVVPDLEENYFFIQTGIKTNHKSIGCYIELKEKLGNDFTWDTIRSAQIHLKFKGHGLDVSTSNLQRLLKNVSLAFGIVLFLSAVWITYSIGNHTISSWGEAILAIFLIAMPCIAGYVVVNSTASLVSASAIEKRLGEIKKRHQIEA